MITNSVLSLGKIGESLATDFLINQNHNIICSNYKSIHGEIDIITLKTGKLNFIEVKTRRNHNVKSAENSITIAKQKKIAKTAMQFLTNNPQYSCYDCCFNVIIIISYIKDESFKIVYTENAFNPECF